MFVEVKNFIEVISQILVIVNAFKNNIVIGEIGLVSVVDSG